MRVFTFLLFCLIINLAAIAQTSTGTIVHNGLTRSFRIFLPSGYNSSVKYPLVLNLHGNNSNASAQEYYSEMNQVADTAKFIVVYPDGISNTWNSGFGHVSTDDVGFISALIDKIIADYSINTQKVYSCGMSMGGFMSFRLSCDLSEKIAAIASITGLVANDVKNNCVTTVPTMFIHGTDDATVPYNGSQYYPSAEGTKDWLVNKNECNQFPTIFEFSDIVNEGSTVKRFAYTDCKKDAEVWFYRVENGGHTWPGAPEVASLGNTNRDIHASVEIWKFFSRHELPASTGYKNIKEEHQLVFPNPFTNQLNLTNYQFRNLTISDISGRVFYSAKTSTESINTAEWPDGMYFLRLESAEGETKIKKVVKLK
jgi:polyhydroxybutyrate depolymerase